ncbi:von Willebrand factor D and EGF domain-containing protein [Mizuhopecten yessoensis]|uniref:von Willebrand factor D and EGF domain-containing protein n=1 Tax=Mizuhopecten yessoensis TaxID=6573 RepID=A0A210PRX2_MIZYE|nr:von Willebrand factor D and EGF domain-containing protein [Mizuhopecten yessoensis]
MPFRFFRIHKYESGCNTLVLLIDYPYSHSSCDSNPFSPQTPYIRFVPDGKHAGRDTHADEIAIYFVKDGLAGMKPVPDLPWRNPSWDIASVDDKNLLGGLYVTEANYDMASFVVTGREIGCGAQLQIWLNDTLPGNDGGFHEKRVCMTNRYNDDICKHNFTVDVMNCGDRRVYRLPELTSDQYDIGTQSVAYCFDVAGLIDPCSSSTPSQIPNLENRRPTNSHAIHASDHLVEDWYSGGHYQLLRWSPDLDQPRCGAESQIWMNGTFPAADGMHHVRQLCTTNRTTGDTCFVDTQYTYVKNCTTHIMYYLTTPAENSAYCFVPFGCMYHPSNGERGCTLTVYILKTSSENMCTSNTIRHHNKCAKVLTGVTKSTNVGSDTWIPTLYEFDIVPIDSKLGTYNLLNNQFVFKLQTQRPHHQFWRNAISDQVNVNVFDAADGKFWQGKRCQVYCDPHMKSFDGMAYELQYPGKFMLLKSENPPMQVQVQITSCNGNNRTPYCACGLVAVAGKDVFQIYTCNGHRDINYKSCKDGVLKVERKSSKIYKIYLPTGATIRVSVRTRGLLDIDITPTVHEYKGRISGLCGDLDGNVANDCVSKGGSMPCRDISNSRWSYYYHPNIFTRSYRLSEEDNLLNVKPNTDFLEPYPAPYQMCVCPQNSIELGDETPVDSYIESTLCSSRQYASCTDSRQEVRCTVTDRRVLRKKRQADSPDDVYLHNITKRSVVINESEAIQLCTDALTTVTNEACSDIGVNASSTEIDNCAADLMLTGDGNWTRYAVDRSETHCLETLEKNTTLQEEYPEISNIIRNNTCSNNCSERGSCSNGKCECEEGFASEDCSFDLNAPLVLYGLDNEGLCDIDDECTFVVVEGLDFPTDQNYTCQFSGRETLVGEMYHTLETANVSAQHQSLFEIICDLPEIHVPTDRLGIEYNVSVAMDGFDFGDVINFVVINAACQYFINDSGVIRFYIQEGFCYINRACHPKGSYKENALCLECKPEESVYTWSNSSSEDCVVSDQNTRDPDTTLEYIIVPVVTVVAGLGFVCLIIGVMLCFCKSKQKSNQMINDISLADPHDEEKEIFSIAWPSKDILQDGIQTEAVNKTKRSKSNSWMRVQHDRSAKSDSDNVFCTSHQPGVENFRKDKTEKKKRGQKSLTEQTCTWNFQQKEENVQIDKKLKTEEHVNNEADNSIVTARYVMFEECFAKDKAEDEMHNTRAGDFFIVNASNNEKLKTDEGGGNIVFVTGRTTDTSRNELTGKADSSHDTYLDTNVKKRERRKRRKKKKKLTSHEPENVVDNTIDGRCEPYVMTPARIETEENKQKHARPFGDEDETQPENEEVVTVKADGISKETLTKSAMVSRSSTAESRPIQQSQEWDEITVIENSDIDVDACEIPGGGETIVRNMESTKTVSQPNTSEATGKRKRRKRKKRRKKVTPETPSGAFASVSKEREGARAKKKLKKNNKSKSKSK